MPADQTSPPKQLPPGYRHDLLNDLNAVIGYATLLIEDLPLGPQQEFAFRLLAAAEQARDRAELLPRSARPRARPILIVGGTAIIARLEAKGIETAEALTVREAVQVLQAAPAAWRGVITDQHLAGVADLEAAANRGGVPIQKVDIAAASQDISIILTVCDQLSV